MEHEINPDGTRNRQYRPYIFGEGVTFSTVGYNPFKSYHYGAYEYDGQLFGNYQQMVLDYRACQLHGNTPSTTQYGQQGYNNCNRTPIAPQSIDQQHFQYQNYGMAAPNQSSGNRGNGMYRRLYAT